MATNDVFSILIATCFNSRVPVDLMPVVKALRNLTHFVCLGDWIYHDGTDDRFDVGLDEVSFPKGSGLVLTLPAPVSGKVPVGAVTVTAGGTGHPVSRTANFSFWVVDPSTGRASAFGQATTDAGGVVTSASITYGGRAGDYTYSGSRAFTEGTDMFTIAHEESWPWRSKYMCQTTVGMSKFMALPLRRYLAPDDHELWNGGFPGSYTGTTKSPPTVTTQAQGYTFAQTARRGVRKLLDQDFHNPPTKRPTTPYVPSGLTGLGLTGTEDFFGVDYFYVDIDAAGNEVTNPKAAVFRKIMLDCLWEKGNYQVGSDDATRNLISPVQEAWLDATQASAVAAGIQSIMICSSKDRFGQNSDGWWSHTTQWNRINANIEAKNYPSFWVTGDRHVPHAGRMTTAGGNVANIEVICPTAAGATSEQIVWYPEMVWADQSPDVPVAGSVEVNSRKRTTTVCVHDMFTGQVKYAVTIPWGSRKAKRTYMAAANVTKPTATPFKPNVYRYYGAWAGRPTAGLAVDDRAWFTDVGVGTGSEWAWDGTYWGPIAPVVLMRQSGSVAAPIATLTGATSGTFLTPGNVLAGMFVRPGMRLTARADFTRTTSIAAATVDLRINNVAVGNVTISSVGTANVNARIESNMECVSSTAQFVELSVAINGTATNVFTDRTVNFGTADRPVTLQLTSANVGDTFVLHGYSLVLNP